jgi:hypothetical protein
MTILLINILNFYCYSGLLFLFGVRRKIKKVCEHRNTYISQSTLKGLEGNTISYCSVSSL